MQAACGRLLQPSGSSRIGVVTAVPPSPAERGGAACWLSFSLPFHCRAPLRRRHPLGPRDPGTQRPGDPSWLDMEGATDDWRLCVYGFLLLLRQLAFLLLTIPGLELSRSEVTATLELCCKPSTFLAFISISVPDFEEGQEVEI